MSNFQEPYRDAGTQYDIDTGYISFFYTGAGANLVGIKRYDSNDVEQEEISQCGSIYGLEVDGFLYVANNGGWGTFVSNNEGFAYGDSTSYTPTETGKASLTDLQDYSASSTPLAEGEVAGGGNGNSASFASAVQSTGNNPALGAAQALDVFISDTSDSALQTAYNNLSTQGTLSQAATQTLPVVTGGTNHAILNTMGTSSNIVQARSNAQFALSTGDLLNEERNLWTKPFYSKADQNNHNSVIGFSTDTYGAVLGADKLINTDLRLGIAGTYSHTKIKGNHGLHHVDINGYELTLYGSYGFSPVTELNFILGGGYFDNEAQRIINFGGLNRKAHAGYDSWSGQVGAGIGHIVHGLNHWDFLSSARVDYLYIENKGYTETGAGALNLRVATQSTDQLVPQVSGKLVAYIKENYSFDVFVGLGYDLLASESSLTSSFVGGGAAFRTVGIDPSPWHITSGVGINYEYKDALFFHLNYDREDRGSDFTHQTFSIKLQMPLD